MSDSDGGDSNPLDSSGTDFVDERCRDIAVTVTEDVNNDGTGERPIANVVVELLTADQIPLSTTST